MLCATSILLTVLFLWSTAFGQAVSPLRETFHVRGTITDPSGAIVPKAKVEFRDKRFDKTVVTNERGVYETELPFGEYTMTAQSMGFRPYRRLLFRVTSTETVVFDFTLPIQSTCDITIVSTDGGTATPTPEEWAAAKRLNCLKEDSFSVPSSDGVPFQVWIRYVTHNVSGDRYSYTVEKAPNDDPVFVTYNLFSLRADEAVYDSESKTIKATGNVVAGESDKTQNADSMAFRMRNGQAISIP